MLAVRAAAVQPDPGSSCNAFGVDLNPGQLLGELGKSDAEMLAYRILDAVGRRLSGRHSLGARPAAARVVVGI
jgi:hypothetical protein